jgi:hypothetical protein
MIAMLAPLPLPEARRILRFVAEALAPMCRFDRVELGMADAVLMASAGAFAEERGELHSLARRCVRLSIAASGIVGDALRFVAWVLFRAARGVS